MRAYRDGYEDEYDPQWWDMYTLGLGAAHTVSGEEPHRDIVAELHAVVEEVTGVPVTMVKARMGFV
jgi:hypothetical protein